MMSEYVLTLELGVIMTMYLINVLKFVDVSGGNYIKMDYSYIRYIVLSFVMVITITFIVRSQNLD